MKERSLRPLASVRPGPALRYEVDAYGPPPGLRDEGVVEEFRAAPSLRQQLIESVRRLEVGLAVRKARESLDLRDAMPAPASKRRAPLRRSVARSPR